jgi:hypothetical protein
MALIELAKVIAADPAASRRWAAEPLPLTDRLSTVITSRPNLRRLIRVCLGLDLRERARLWVRVLAT